MARREAVGAQLGRPRPAGTFGAAIRFVLARTLALAAVVGVALTVAAAVLVLTRSDPEGAPGAPAEASVTELRALAEQAEAPIYWAGTAPGTRFEVTETRGGKVFVRYLPPGVDVADRRPEFLTVGTYPYPRAYAVTERSAQRDGMTSAQAPGGGLATWREKRPSSVYVAYPGSDLLVEVFSPKAAQARRLVLDGAVGPVTREPAQSEATPRLLPPVELDPDATR